jgi:hypothetical protein
MIIRKFSIALFVLFVLARVYVEWFPVPFASIARVLEDTRDIRFDTTELELHSSSVFGFVFRYPKPYLSEAIVVLTNPQKRLSDREQAVLISVMQRLDGENRLIWIRAIIEESRKMRMDELVLTSALYPYSDAARPGIFEGNELDPKVKELALNMLRNCIGSLPLRKSLTRKTGFTEVCNR